MHPITQRLAVHSIADGRFAVWRTFQHHGNPRIPGRHAAPVRAGRKLLLKKKKIVQLLGAVAKQGATLVPPQIHFNDQGRAKVLLGVGTGRQKQDKREAIKDRDWKRDKARLMSHRG
jgi:tmRNA-binding protein